MCFFKKRKQKKAEEARKAAELENQKEVEETANQEAANEEENAVAEEAATEEIVVKEETTEEVEEETPAAEAKEERKGVYRVVYDKEDKLWKIKRDGAKRVIESKQTKEEALRRVKELSGNKEVGFVVHKKDGKFQKKQNLRISNNDNK